jgi:hypothetical protein
LNKIGATSRLKVISFFIPEFALLELPVATAIKQTATRRGRVSFLAMAYLLCGLPPAESGLLALPSYLNQAFVSRNFMNGFTGFWRET